MALDFGMISFVMIIVLWAVFVVSRGRRDRLLEQRLESLEDMRRKNGLAAENLTRLEQRVENLEAQLAHLR